MKERPILFSAPMVRAILAGTKTQTRRVVKRHPSDDGNMVLVDHGDGWWPYRSDDSESPVVNGDEIPYRCPYGQPGDRLWVREAWAAFGPFKDGMHCYYRATDDRPEASKWKPSIHMPRWASRILLEIVAVRVERLGDISREDAEAEGVGLKRVSENDHRWIDYNHKDEGRTFGDPRHSFWSLWESVNGKESHDANPWVCWVWVVEFRRVMT